MPSTPISHLPKGVATSLRPEFILTRPTKDVLPGSFCLITSLIFQCSLSSMCKYKTGWLTLTMLTALMGSALNKPLSKSKLIVTDGAMATVLPSLSYIATSSAVSFSESDICKAPILILPLTYSAAVFSTSGIICCRIPGISRRKTTK